MEAGGSASGTPTPEALLGMLGKLKRTLTQNLSEQKRTTDDKGYIAAANIRSSVTDDVPNLLRPSPGLDFLSQSKLLLRTDQAVDRSPTAAALELESSAPPMDLDRPQGSSAQPSDLPQPSSTPSFPGPDAASPLSLAELAQLSEVSTNPGARDPGTASDSAMASDAESALNVGQADGTESANAAEADPAVAAESALKSGSASDTLALMKPPASDKPVQHATDEEQAQVALTPLDNPTQALAGDASGVTAVRPREQSSHATDVQGKRQLLGGDGGGERQVLGGDGGGEKQVVPSTEEDLDSAMQELAQEVSQLQPAGQGTANEGPAKQGSYLHRHTSSLILKMSQDAAVPPLPAVANLGPSTRSQATSPAVAPGKGAKPGDARKTIKSMAASLFKAFDEGKLREQGPTLGEVGSRADEQPLTAAIRTYKSSPKRREAAPATVQQATSPARTTSYSLQKASLRRSLSPSIGRQAPALRQPQWDSSKRLSPQRAQRVAASLDLANISDTSLDSQPSPQHAQRSPGGQISSLEQAQHAAEGSSQPGSSSVEVAGNKSQVQQTGENTLLASFSQQPKPQLAGKSAALSSAASDATTNALNAPGCSVTLSNAAGMRSGSRAQSSRTPTPSPPRFCRLPPNNLTERPAWASTTASRAGPPAPPGGSSPLRHSTGSSTIPHAPQIAAPPPQPTTAATPQDARTGKAISPAPRTSAVSVSQLVRPRHSQASSDSYADYLADSQAHAHAHALQQLQQAMEGYHSSSPHVMVPAAVELVAALRRAAKGPAPARLSLEALQLAGLKLKHEGGGGDHPGQSVPTAPWPEWVRGAWGSPQAQVRGVKEPATAAAPDSEEEAQAEASSNAERKPSQRAQHDARVSDAKPSCHGWSPVKRPESLAGWRRSALVSRALLEAEAAAAKRPQSGLVRPHNPPRAARPSTTANPRTSATPPRGAARVSTTPPRSAATPPWGAARPSRVSTHPHRAAATPPRATQQAQLSQQPVGEALPSKKLHASLSQASQAAKSPSMQDIPAVALHRHTGEHSSASQHAPKGHSVPFVKGRQSVERAKSPPGRKVSVQSKQRENAMQAFGLHAFAQHTNLTKADCSRGHPALIQVSEGIAQPAEAQHSDHAKHAETLAAALHSSLDTDSQRPPHNDRAEASPTALHSSSDADFQRPSHAEHAAATPSRQHSNSDAQPHAVVAPLHSVTSVAALRLSFEQMSPSAVSSVDSVKPRNRLPLRKVSSKAHVHEGDGSPQQAALLWQQSLRGADDGHAEDHAEPDQAMQQGEEAHSKHTAAGATSNASPLYHTMSAVVAQRSPPRPVADQGPAPWGQFGSSRLTEAVLAAADDVKSSAEKLPVSHRLPVSRSVFDSDEGSLVSSDDQGDDKAVYSSPQDGSMQPLAEEATLALLPDRGMSPVSESAEEHPPSGSGRARQADSAGLHRLPAQHAQRASHPNQVERDEVYPWSSLGWAFSPSWIRVICQLCPAPLPHFATPLPPHTLQTNLGMHATDIKTYAFDQVLSSDCSQQDLAEQATGVIEAVLQGHNSVVLAMGQPAFGRPHTLLGVDPNDPEVDSSSLGVSAMLVDTLFSEMQQQQLPVQVHSVYVTAFQVVDETIQDLLQTQQPSDHPQQRSLSGSSISQHDVYVDKQKRTWVSNLAAVKISSSAGFQHMLQRISSFCHPSASSSALRHPSHASSPTCVITLLVTADVPTASIPSSGRQQVPNSAVSQSHSPSGAAAQSPTTRLCSKLSFVEVGSSTVPVQATPVRTVSAGQALFPPIPHLLGRGSSGVSVASSRSRCSTLGDRPQRPPSGVGVARGSVVQGRSGKSQDITVRSVSEVVWAAAYGKGMPVPYRACKLTRYLQDTLCPSGRAVAVVCVNPSAASQTSSTPALTAAERMMPV